MSAQVATARSFPSGFVMIDNRAVDAHELSPHALALYLILSRHVNHETGLAFPSITYLCKVAHMARATVVKYLKELESKGWIEVIRRHKPDSKEREVNQYRVKVPEGEAKAPARAARGGFAPEPEVVHDANTSGLLDEPNVVQALNGGSSSPEQGVVQGVNGGSSRLEQGVVHEVDGKDTEPQKNQEDKTNPIQEDAARSAATTQCDPDRLDDEGSPQRSSSPLENQSWQKFCHTLANICCLDYNANEGKIQRFASRLWNKGNGYTVEDLKTFKAWWYQYDWRGRKGERPTLQIVAEYIRIAVETPGMSNQGDDLQSYLARQGEYASIIDY